MSKMLDALHFPLHGSQLIEASAGTGKTWTIAALYVRLVIGHGAAGESFARPLLPSEILVMTFTRAATRELSDRIRSRLLQAARCFRGEEVPASDAFVRDLLADYQLESERKQAAYLLALAAESMDDAAVFTIDAWCQRMLREHAFDSGNLFDEELLPDEAELFETAVRDYWRQQVYPLSGPTLDALLKIFSDHGALQAGVRQLLALDVVAKQSSSTLGALIISVQNERARQLAQLKQGWADKAQAMGVWLEGQLARKDKPFSGRKMQVRFCQTWLAALQKWADNAEQEQPDISESGWFRLTPEGLRDAANDPAALLALPSEFSDFAALRVSLDALPTLKPMLLQHASNHIHQRLAQLKQQAGLFSFADMLQRLDGALAGPNAASLRARILNQYPVALIDEFQDTSPLQYRLFDQLYRTADNDAHSALLLIGDPKQSIYAFRGADIHSYLAARRATTGRHYALATNYRSSHALVEAINQIFALAQDYPAGAFRYRRDDDDPLPFTPVAAAGRKEVLHTATGAQPALTLWSHAETVAAAGYLKLFSARCAEQIVTLLNDPQAGFLSEDAFARLKPADIAVLVRTGKEAAAVRQALRQRGVASVYLSDKDSVFQSEEALDLLRWLCAIANPLDGRLARAALATAIARLEMAELENLTRDDQAWEARIEEMKRLRTIWQRQGVLAMLRQWLHGLNLPARLLAETNGERSLTNILHLAELLQAASLQQDGEQALIRWLAEKIDDPASGGDAAIVRLESDADLVKVVTIHKSKGLEYPLVFLPFVCSFRATTSQKQNLFSWIDENGVRQIDFSLSSTAASQVDSARLQEDLRLLYVALTRPRHALWLGIAPLKVGRSDKSQLHHSAFGYLLAGGQTLEPAELTRRLEQLQSAQITLESLPPERFTRLQRPASAVALGEPAHYQGQFERNWSIASFSALTRDLAAPSGWLSEDVRDDAPPAELAPIRAAEGWHAFPRGPVPGNFLHDQLEWLAGEGFRPEALPWLAERCNTIGWGHRAEIVTHWLEQVTQTVLPALGCSLIDIAMYLPEMEFWFPVDAFSSGQLDALCRTHILPGQPRSALPARDLHGMLKGFADLVFEHDGKYWVLDYKSNALGETDAAYTAGAMNQAMLQHRYDVQAAIYLLALHRLLRQRLGEAYQPETQLGGAVYLFLRGIAGPEAGCCFIAPPLRLLEELDRLLA